MLADGPVASGRMVMRVDRPVVYIPRARGQCHCRRRDSFRPRPSAVVASVRPSVVRRPVRPAIVFARRSRPPGPATPLQSPRRPSNAVAPVRRNTARLEAKTSKKKKRARNVQLATTANSVHITRAHRSTTTRRTPRSFRE